MEEEVVEQSTVVSILFMPCRLDRSVHIELEDRMCALFSKEDVPRAHIRELKDYPHLFDI